FARARHATRSFAPRLPRWLASPPRGAISGRSASTPSPSGGPMARWSSAPWSRSTPVSPWGWWPPAWSRWPCGGGFCSRPPSGSSSSTVRRGGRNSSSLSGSGRDSAGSVAKLAAWSGSGSGRTWRLDWPSSWPSSPSSASCCPSWRRWSSPRWRSPWSPPFTSALRDASGGGGGWPPSSPRFLFAVVFPSLLVAFLLSEQAAELLGRLATVLGEGSLGDRLGRLGWFLSPVLERLEALGIADAVRGALGQLGTLLSRQIGPALGALAEIGIGTFILLVGIYYLFQDGPALFEAIVEIVPMDRAYAREVGADLAAVLRSLFLATFFTGIVQGIL